MRKSYATHRPGRYRSHVARPERILIIRPSALGDVCRSVGLAAALRKHRPHAEIHWLVNSPFAPVLEAHPAIDRVIPFDRKALGSASRRLSLAPILGFLRSLRAARYDIVIDAQGLARSGLFAFATGAQIRIGHADARELGWLGLNRKVKPTPSQHTVDRMMSLLAPLGIQESSPDLRLFTRQEDRDWLAEQPELQSPYLVFAPTSLWPGKRWPIERFTALARSLASDGWRIAVVGAPGERDQCTALLALSDQGLPVFDLIGKTSVGQLLAVIERSELVLANDSAALHMAVGLGRPIVALFGPTHTHLVGPYRLDASVIQHITPKDNLDHKNAAAARELMARISTNEVHSRIMASPAKLPEIHSHI